MSTKSGFDWDEEEDTKEEYLGLVGMVGTRGQSFKWSKKRVYQVLW